MRRRALNESVWSTLWPGASSTTHTISLPWAVGRTPQARRHWRGEVGPFCGEKHRGAGRCRGARHPARPKGSDGEHGDLARESQRRALPCELVDGRYAQEGHRSTASGHRARLRNATTATNAVATMSRAGAIWACLSITRARASTGTDGRPRYLASSRTRPWSSNPTNYGYGAAPSSSSSAGTVPASSTRRC